MKPNNATDAFNSMFKEVTIFKIVIEFEDHTQFTCPFRATSLSEALSMAETWAEQPGNKLWVAIFEAGKPETGINPLRGEK